VKKRAIAHVAVVAALLACGATAGVPTQSTVATPNQAAAGRTFASQIEALSEPGGYFDTDNLISNERSYLDVVPALRRLEVRGGAYVGVGPDQNFTYIAAVRPDIAFIVDVRRDNLLLHLLFKALFTLSGTRVEYLAALVGRPVPADVQDWRTAPIERIVVQMARPPLDARGVDALRERVDQAIGRMGVKLSREDRETIDRFHRRFIESGVGLKFQSTGRPPQSHYPSFEELLLGRDPSGEPANYLASDDRYQTVRRMQQDDLIVPVVGDLGGPRAVAAIGTLLQQRKLQLSAFYTSNVEFYLFGDARFDRFVANLAALPRAANSVVIRSVFGRFARGAGSTSHLQSTHSLVNGYAKGQFRYYGELIDGR